jgi:hypothetical protein
LRQLLGGRVQPTNPAWGRCATATGPRYGEADHPALLAAVDAADQVVPVFVVDRALLDGRPSGPNRRAFLHGALRSLARDLEALGARPQVLEGDPVPAPGRVRVPEELGGAAPDGFDLDGAASSSST